MQESRVTTVNREEAFTSRAAADARERLRDARAAESVAYAEWGLTRAGTVARGVADMLLAVAMRNVENACGDLRVLEGRVRRLLSLDRG